VPYFDEPVGRVKIQTTSKNSQRYYTTKRLIRDLLSNTPNVLSVRENFADIYLPGMPDRSKRTGTELAREIQLTDWSTAGNLSNRSSGVQIPRDICTRFRRYFYSTKSSWIIIVFIPPRHPPKKFIYIYISNECVTGKFLWYPGNDFCVSKTLWLSSEHSTSLAECTRGAAEDFPFLLIRT